MKFVEILAGSTDPHSKDWGYLPYIFNALANTLWPLGWIYANEHNMNFAETNMVRGIVFIALNYLPCRMMGIPLDYKNSGTLKILVIRSLLMVLYSFCFAFSQSILPLPIVHTIACCGTLFVFLIDFLLNSVKINSKQGVGIFVGFLGALITVNSSTLAKWIYEDYEEHTQYQNYITDSYLVKGLFSLVFLGGMALWALAVVITKKTYANTFQIIYIFGLQLFFMGALIYPSMQSKTTPSQLLISILLTGLPLMLAQWLFVVSLTMTKNTGVVNMLSFVSIFVGVLVSVFRYHQQPTLFSVGGILMVFVGVWKTIFNKDSPK